MNDIDVLKQEFDKFKLAVVTTEVLKEVVAELISRVDNRVVASVVDDLNMRIKEKAKILYP